jgi:hypothetical protein
MECSGVCLSVFEYAARIAGVCLCVFNPAWSTGVAAALQYAQEHFEQFQCDSMPAIKQLMGRLLYSHRDLHETPYKHLEKARLLDEVAVDFTRAACSTLGQVRSASDAQWGRACICCMCCPCHSCGRCL